MEQRTDQYSQIIFAESHEIKMELFKRCIMEEFHLLLQLSMFNIQTNNTIDKDKDICRYSETFFPFLRFINNALSAKTIK